MDPFLEACGATGPLQLSIECQAAPQAERVAFDLPFVLIGRDPGADLHFPHLDVSERHVYLQMVAGHLCYMDLGSRMGTYLGGQCVRSGWVPRDKTIRVGPYRVRLVGGDVRDGSPPERPTGGFAPPPLPDGTPPRLTLELSHRGIRPALCAIHGDLTLIGSSTDCDVRVLDPSVSNYHCSLLHAPGGVWVVDLLGRGGVTVNGASVRYARLDDGDELRVGHSRIRLRTAAPPAAEARVFSLPAGLLAEMVPEPRPESLPLPAAPALEGAVVAAAGVPALAQGELVEAILTPLADRFDLMQQQMFEQLHQVGMVMFERFAALHEEQVRALHQELDQFRRLTRELDTLRADLATRAREAPPEHPHPNGAVPTRLGLAIAAPSRPVAPNGGPLVARAELNGNRNGHGVHRPDLPPTRETAGVRIDTSPEQAPEADILAALAVARRGEDLGETPSAPARERRPDADIHAWLCQRISMIQNEQQSRWQRILSMIPGQLLGKPTL